MEIHFHFKHIIISQFVHTFFDVFFSLSSHAIYLQFLEGSLT